MADRRAFLWEVPGDPCSDYLRATLPLAQSPDDAGVLVLPALTPATATPLAAALAAGKPVLLPWETLPGRLSREAGESLSALIQNGLILCPLTELPRWARGGTSCRTLLTLERLKAFAAQGFDRIYLANLPGATPLAAAEAKRRNIHLTGGTYPGIGQSHRFGLVYAEK